MEAKSFPRRSLGKRRVATANARRTACRVARHFVAPAVAALLCASGPTAARADVVFGDDRELLNVTSHNSYRVWHVTDNQTNDTETIRQAVTRLQGTFKLSDSVDMVLHTAGAFGELRQVDNSALDGIGDVKLKSFWHTWNRQLLLSLGVNLPSGQTSLNEQEVRAAQSLSPHVFGFRMKNYGEGFDVDLGVAVGRDVNANLTVGGGVSFLARGEYSLDSQSEFKPAPEVSVTAGADWRGSSFRGSADVVYRYFGTDQLDGADSFEEGAQIEMGASAALRGEKWGLDLRVRDVVKLDNELLLALPPGTDTRVENGNNFWVFVTPRYQPHERWSLLGLFDAVAVNQSQQQQSSAWAASFGLGVEVRLTPVAIAEARMVRMTGGTESDAFDFSGWDTALAMRWQY